MSYFNKIPNLLYLKYTKNPYDGQWIEIKNIFSRIKLVDDVKGNISTFNDYIIEDGDRPDTISFDMYGDPNYDWTILLLNNMINFYEDWPKSKTALDSYVTYKYQNPEDVHHYETIEQLQNEKVVVAKGIRVDEAYQYVTAEGITLTKTQSRISVSNYSYEINKNEQKRDILLLKPDLIPQFNQKFVEAMRYSPSTEFKNEALRISQN
tara:strand:+ start:329 stop:952 length:624 start_codon:yes stop_codon:yes gene_type:complete